MWFNSMQREEPYLVLTSGGCSEMDSAARSPETGAAWLSSARVVRCWVKSRNERNPYRYLPLDLSRNFNETADVESEEGEDDVKSSWPL